MTGSGATQSAETTNEEKQNKKNSNANFKHLAFFIFTSQQHIIYFKIKKN